MEKPLRVFPLHSPVAAQKKTPDWVSFFMELMIRFELTTSSLPRTRSTY